MSELYQRLTDFNKDLLPDKVQLKYEAMSENAFRFFSEVPATCFTKTWQQRNHCLYLRWPGFAAISTLKISAVIKPIINSSILT